MYKSFMINVDYKLSLYFRYYCQKWYLLIFNKTEKKNKYFDNVEIDRIDFDFINKIIHTLLPNHIIKKGYMGGFRYNQCLGIEDDIDSDWIPGYSMNSFTTLTFKECFDDMIKNLREELEDDSHYVKFHYSRSFINVNDTTKFKLLYPDLLNEF